MGRVERNDSNGAVSERTAERADSGVGEAASTPESTSDDRQIGAAERLTNELARLRSKFGVDPAIARASFEDAWMSPTATMEEDEAEFIDAVADCLGVGLSLDAALVCWDTGGLSYDGEQAQSEEDEEEEEDEAVTRTPMAVAAIHHHLGGRRLLIP